MAPIKALCSEKYREWYHKFEKLHDVKVIEMTGDTDTKNDDITMNSANIICTTPVKIEEKKIQKLCFFFKEKWDLITRKSKNRNAILKEIKLFLIDEIHVLGESARGACIEAVISRMKKFAYSSPQNENNFRFLAISATIPNIEDVGFIKILIKYLNFVFFSISSFHIGLVAIWTIRCQLLFISN